MSEQMYHHEFWLIYPEAIALHQNVRTTESFDQLVARLGGDRTAKHIKTTELKDDEWPKINTSEGWGIET